MKSFICFLMSFLLVMATPALSLADDGGFKNELGLSVSFKDYGVMTDLNLFSFHIRAGISAPAVRDAIVDAAKLTGRAAAQVLDVSKDVIVFTGRQAIEMAEFALDHGISATKYAYDQGKSMLVFFGKTAKYIAKKIAKATKKLAKLTRGVVVSTGRYAAQALKISFQAIEELTEDLYDLGEEVIEMAFIGVKNTGKFLKATTVMTGTFIANVGKGAYAFLKYSGKNLLSLLEKSVDGVIKFTKAAYQETKYVSLTILKLAYKGGKYVVKKIVWAGKKTLKALRKTFKFLFGWIPEIGLALSVGHRTARLEVFSDSIIDLQLN